MFVVFYSVNLYICVFMTCSTSYCLYDILLDPWNVCMLQRGFNLSVLFLKVVGLFVDNFVCIMI
jgi:hypothetical protein